MRFGAINKKNLGEKTSELDLFGYIGTGPSLFAAFCLRSVLMPLALTVIAYLFRNLAAVVGSGSDQFCPDRLGIPVSQIG